MPVVATFTVSAAQFVITRAIPGENQVRVRVERIISDEDGVTPVFWLTGDAGHVERTTSTLQGFDATSDLTTIDTVDDRTLYRMTWTGQDGDLLTRLGRGPGRLLCAHGTRDGCELVVHFPSEDALADFEAWCETTGIPMPETDVERIQRDDITFDTELTGSDVLVALTHGISAFSTN